jgi:hypothetical protein
MSRRREGRWKAGPVVVSVLLHGAVVGLLALSQDAPPPPPKVKVYAVDIVSPPPNVAGAPPTEALGNQEPGPAASPAPAPAAETPPAPAPEPPAPAPDPAPPRAEAPKEPAKAPEPRRTPPERPTPPTPRPSTPAPEKSRPSTPAPEKNRPATPVASRPAATPEKNRPTSAATGTNRPAATPEKNRPGGSGTTGGSGTGTTRTRGDGASTAPATGSNPQAGSAGGEGLNIHVEGEPCPVAGYCERVTIQVQRYFRGAAGNPGARGEVCFRIQRDGTVTDIQAQRVRGGGAAFRLAMMEAAEAAGSRKAFGTLPAAFDPQRWRWCVELSPR